MNASHPPLPHPPQSEGSAPVARRLDAGAGAAWWGESWRIFCAAPLAWIGIFVAFVVISIALAMIPLIGGLASTVLTPVFAGGVMLGCQALAEGRPLSVGHLFEGFQRPHFPPLLTLGLVLLAVFFVIAVAMVATVFLTLGASGLAALMDFGGTAPLDYTALLTSGMSILVAALVALLVTLLAATAFWFAPALVVLNGEPPLSALAKSFAASWQNVGAFVIYGLIYFGLAFVATLPAGLGWLVLGPMVVGSCYAGWRTIFGRL